MKPTLLLPALALGTGLAFTPAQVQAANARNPYQNVDHRNDAGNDTGDSQVDQLNSQQLDENYHPGQRPPGAQQAPGALNPGGAHPGGAPGTLPQR